MWDKKDHAFIICNLTECFNLKHLLDDQIFLLNPSFAFSSQLLPQEAKLGHAASREEIADALREVMRRVLSGEPAVDIFLGNDRNSQSVATVLTRRKDDMGLQDSSVPQAKTTSIL